MFWCRGMNLGFCTCKASVLALTYTLSPYCSLLWIETSSPELTSHPVFPASLLCHKTLLPGGRLWGGGVRNHLSSYRQCWSMGGGLNKSMLIKYMKQWEELTIKFKKDTWHYGSNLVYTRLHKRKRLWGKGEERWRPVQCSPRIARPALRVSTSSGWEHGPVREALGSNCSSAKSNTRTKTRTEAVGRIFVCKWMNRITGSSLSALLTCHQVPCGLG